MGLVIAVGGQLACGKDTLADHLAEVLNKGEIHWERRAFASAVKKVFMDAFGEDMDFIEKWKRIDEAPPGYLKNIRKALQFIGDGFRQIQDDIWIRIALRESANMIFSDSRYINEGKAVDEQKGFNILIGRPGFENNDPNPSEAQIRPLVAWCVRNIKSTSHIAPFLVKTSADDPPPPGLEHYHYFVNNDGTVEDLYELCDKRIRDAVNSHFRSKQ